MKKVFLVAAMAVFTSTSFAQLLTGKSASLAKEIEEPSRNWSYLYMQYNGISWSGDGGSESLDGLSMGYNWNKSVSESLPLFIEFGIGGQVAIQSEIESFSKLTSSYSKSSEKVDFIMPSVKIPLGVSYVYDIPNTPISIIPQAGIDFRINLGALLTGDPLKDISGHSSLDLCDKDKIEEFVIDIYKKQLGSYYSGYEATAHKDAEEFADRFAFNRFQVGAHIGVNARFWNKLLVGFNYQFDFNEIAKDVKMNQANFTLGICF